MTGSSPETSPRPALAIDDLFVAYRQRRGPDTPALSGVTLRVPAGGSVAVVGESGSGKSTLAAAVIGLLPRRGVVASGGVQVDGVDVRAASPRALRDLRGRRVGYVGQLPYAAFDPLFALGPQLDEAAAAHARETAASRRERVDRALEAAGLPLTPAELAIHPHRMSGGMLQRAQLAAAILHGPALLVADEPTSALDAVRWRQVADLLASLRARTGTALLVVTHDLALAAAVADETVVLRQGRVVESGPTRRVLDHPADAYTAALVAALPSRAAATGGA
jgi:peptide/nickel transport system ATP-binding protein